VKPQDSPSYGLGIYVRIRAAKVEG